MRALSPSDQEELQKAFKLSNSLTFNGRTALTHGKDWQEANLGIMRYEDMFDDDTPDREEHIAYLREPGRHLRL